MASTLTYTVFSLGEAQLHQIHTSHGKVSVTGRVHALKPAAHFEKHLHRVCLVSHPPS